MYTLGTAAAAAGLAKSTVLRAIKGGRLSAQRDSNGQWSIDPAEFHRVFPPMMAEPTQRETLTDAMVAQLNKVIEDLRSDRDHWRTEAADWKAQAQRLLPRRRPRPQRQTHHRQHLWSDRGAARGDGCGRRGSLASVK